MQFQPKNDTAMGAHCGRADQGPEMDSRRRSRLVERTALVEGGYADVLIILGRAADFVTFECNKPRERGSRSRGLRDTRDAVLGHSLTPFWTPLVPEMSVVLENQPAALDKVGGLAAWRLGGLAAWWTTFPHSETSNLSESCSNICQVKARLNKLLGNQLDKQIH